MKNFFNLFLRMSLIAFAATSLWSESTATATVSKGVAVVGNEKVPVFPGVTEVSVWTNENAVRVSYEAVGAHENKIAAFYAGKKVLGTKVPRFKQGSAGGPTAFACKRGKGVIITLEGGVKENTIMVSISNDCPK